MEKNEFAKSANYQKDPTKSVKNRQLAKALDALGDLIGIEFGSLTIHFHKGRWSPKIEIRKNVFQEIE